MIEGLHELKELGDNRFQQPINQFVTKFPLQHARVNKISNEKRIKGLTPTPFTPTITRPEDYTICRTCLLSVSHTMYSEMERTKLRH